MAGKAKAAMTGETHEGEKLGMGTKKIRAAVFNFLLDHFRSQEPFTENELEDHTNWRGQTFGTYWSKQYKQLVVLVDSDTFRVSEAFRPYSTWESFRNLVTQVRHASSEYTSLLYKHVIVYEFFMPLTNEGHLRTALDALFYKNTILSRLKTLDRIRLERRFSKEQGEQEKTTLTGFLAGFPGASAAIR
jgi:hypothetical protein